MPSALTRKLLLGVAFLLAANCWAARYPDSAQATRTTVTVHVVWLPSFKIVNEYCSMLMGQPPPTKGTIVGCFDPETMTIYAVQPHNFNDSTRLEILGHEFWHALGAEHPELD